MADARAGLDSARADQRAAADALGREATATVSAPAGRVIWSVLAGEGAAVNAGDSIASWIDCRVVLVDKPALDLEVALLHEGMQARVKLDGEPEPRAARVLLARGSASTLGRDDLAAVARRAAGGEGQVLLQLETRPDDGERCRIGRAASVELLDVRLLDLIRAWLRL